MPEPDVPPPIRRLCRELLDRRENLEMVILTEGAEGSRVFTRTGFRPM